MKIIISKVEMGASVKLHETLLEVLSGFGYKPSTSVWELIKTSGVIYKDDVLTIKRSINSDLTISINDEMVADFLLIYSDYIVAIKCPLQSMLLSAKQLIEASTKFGVDIKPKIDGLANKYSDKVPLIELGIFANESNNSILKDAVSALTEEHGVSSYEEEFNNVKITKTQLIAACRNNGNFESSYSDLRATACGAFDTVYNKINQ